MHENHFLRSIKLKALIFICGICFPFLGWCGGFPTSDLIAAIQRTTDNISQLEQYEEQLNIRLNGIEQLTQQIKAWEQQLVEYDHMLQQMQGIKTRIEDKDALQSIKDIKDLYHNNPFFGYEVNEDDSAYKASLEASYSVYGTRSNNQEMIDLIENGPYTEKDKIYLKNQWKDLNTQDSISVNQISTGTRHEMNLQELIEMRSETRDAVNRLGDEDYLATLQTLAEQNQVIMQMLEQTINIQKDHYQKPNLINQVWRNEAQDMERKLNRKPRVIKRQSAEDFAHLYDF